MFSNFFPENEIMCERYGRAGQATDDMEHALCMLDT